MQQSLIDTVTVTEDNDSRVTLAACALHGTGRLERANELFGELPAFYEPLL